MHDVPIAPVFFGTARDESFKREKKFKKAIIMASKAPLAESGILN